MQYQDYNEHINHGTPDRPLAFYHVDERHPRYHMPMHWHIECEIIYVREGLLRLYVDDMRIAAAAGDVVFIGRGALHGGTPEDCVYECLVFDPGALLKSEPCAPFLTPLLTRSLWIRRQSESGAACTALAERLFACAQAPSDSGMLRAVGCLYEMYGLLPVFPRHRAPLAHRLREFRPRGVRQRAADRLRHDGGRGGLSVRLQRFQLFHQAVPPLQGRHAQAVPRGGRDTRKYLMNTCQSCFT